MKEIHTKLFQICSLGFLSKGLKNERVRNSRGKRAISVRATEVLLYRVRQLKRPFICLVIHLFIDFFIFVYIM